ncbi:MAG: cell division/cell wall cluster transcriptional repressor MraZ [Dysgonamonadaceae bacterium]|jgi:MraZ protein|nr:cell division/cell wall cluster transcriptional repressor MraZ [Dysgonamonadaceae bacterium]
MERFLGNIDAKADAKGRLFVPAIFRKNLLSSGESRLILRKDIYQDCLVLFPGSTWEEELAVLRSRLNRWDEKQQMLYRQFILDAEALEMDSNGRILIPKRYFLMAGITSEVRFVGIDYTIEIWARNKLEKPLVDAVTFKQGMQKWMGT